MVVQKNSSNLKISYKIDYQIWGDDENHSKRILERNQTAITNTSKCLIGHNTSSYFGDKVVTSDVVHLIYSKITYQLCLMYGNE